MPSEIKFSAIPQSPRRNKVSEDGGGFRVTLDLDESQFDAWVALAKSAGKLLTFSAQGNVT